MTKKKTRKKYVRKAPTVAQLKEELRLSEEARYGAARNFEQSFRELQKKLDQANQQLQNAHQLIDAQYAEISILRENNLSLTEAIIVLGRKNRMEKQERIFSSYKDTSNQMQALATPKNLDNYFDANS